MDFIQTTISGGQQAGVNQNRIWLVEKTNFLAFSNRMIQMSMKKPAELVGATLITLFKMIDTLSASALQFAKRIA